MSSPQLILIRSGTSFTEMKLLGVDVLYVKGAYKRLCCWGKLVTSFDTLFIDAEGKENFLISHMPSVSGKFDLVRWKNSMHRDFTINSVCLDNPFILWKQLVCSQDL